MQIYQKIDIQVIGLRLDMGRPMWVCIDCGNEISEVGKAFRVSPPNNQFEYCFRCNNWEPEVVIKYL